MEIPKTFIDFLSHNKIAYEILHHPEAFTAQTVAAAEHIKGRQHAKVVMVKSGGQHLMTVLPADHRVDLEKDRENHRPAGCPAGRKRIQIALSRLRGGNHAAVR